MGGGGVLGVGINLCRCVCVMVDGNQLLRNIGADQGRQCVLCF